MSSLSKPVGLPFGYGIVLSGLERGIGVICGVTQRTEAAQLGSSGCAGGLDRVEVAELMRACIY